jgi:excisionase family DNA binding protein
MLLDDDYDYVTVPEAARRLNLTEKRVIELARRGVLRSYQDGVLWVQCALVSGAVD